MSALRLTDEVLSNPLPSGKHNIIVGNRLACSAWPELTSIQNVEKTVRNLSPSCLFSSVFCFLEALPRCTDTVFASARQEIASKTIASGTGKPVPYRVQSGFLGAAKTLRRTLGTRNVFIYSIVSIPCTCNKRIRRCLNAPLKKQGLLWCPCRGRS